MKKLYFILYIFLICLFSVNAFAFDSGLYNRATKDTIAIAASVLSGTTSGYILYNNGGVLADTPLTTDGTDVTVPAGTSITLESGASIDGVSALKVSTSVSPDVADSATLGTALFEWSDAYFADGVVLYFQNDQSVTLTSGATGLIFNMFPVTPSAAPDADYEVANKKYVDDVVASGFSSTSVDSTTWSDGANASNIWTFDVSGTDTTMTFGNGTGAFAGTWTATAFSGPLTGNVTGNVTGSSGSCTGNAATVSTITGLAPDTATTQATQPNITSAANLVTVGALNSGSITSGFGAINNGSSAITTTGTIQGSVIFNSYSSAQTLTAASHNSSVVQMTVAGEVTMWDCETANIGQFTTLWARDAEKIEVVPASGDHFVLFDGTALTANYELDMAATAGTKVTLLCTADDTWSVYAETAACLDGGAAD